MKRRGNIHEVDLSITLKRMKIACNLKKDDKERWHQIRNIIVKTKSTLK